MFDRKQDAGAWEQDQSRKLRAGDLLDPRRGWVTLASIEPVWTESRKRLKRKTQEADASAWAQHTEPEFGRVEIASITEAQVATRVGGLVAGGLSTSTANRYLSTLRSLLAFAVVDGRIPRNAAAVVTLPSGGRGCRGGEFWTPEELDAFARACKGRYAELVKVLGLCGLRWGGLAGLKGR
ncbi:tyrosine-type recombinase/integrase [Lapillicoccus sp.]|uniref:tyrosine-type recombinase/integrase n=1 Tax=Lapillicoccus sp. TaxID=1909287 RepID=UPI003983172A